MKALFLLPMRAQTGNSKSVLTTCGWNVIGINAVVAPMKNGTAGQRQSGHNQNWEERRELLWEIRSENDFGQT